MRKLGLSLAVALAATVAAAPAYAVSVDYTAGSSALPDNGKVLQDFESIASGSLIGSNTYVYSDTTTSASGATSTKPSVGSGNFASVLAGGSYTYNLTTFAPVLSFLVGTLDGYNSVTLSFTTGDDETYAGSQLGTLDTSGRVTFDTGSATQLIKSITFASSANAFEIDTITSAAPEPATWAMLILGFGFAGMALRSSRRGKLALA